VISTEAADSIREAIKDAVSKGAKCAIDESIFPESKSGTAYVSPQILLSVNDSMKIVNDEVFGPVMAIIPVASDEEAIKAINKSKYGLTASVWTKDSSILDSLAKDLEVGTVYMNRCDYLDPALAWIGIKNSGKGAALSEFGFNSFTRLQSRHYRL
jgi:acyl-CoA reductase-like NAD-dependent aldehyde dehydrogenase